MSKFSFSIAIFTVFIAVPISANFTEFIDDVRSALANPIKYDEALATELSGIYKLEIDDEKKRGLSFSLHDLNKDGSISLDELKTVKFAWDVHACLADFNASLVIVLQNNGCATKADLIAHGFGSPESDDIDAFFKAVDKNGNNCLDWAELKKFCVTKFTLVEGIYFKRAFPLMDKDGDGKLSYDEFMALDWAEINWKVIGVNGGL